MHHEHESAYGLWWLVIINSAVFILFAFSFFRPRTKRDWRTFGSFAAFIVALFVEMYGFPLTIYLLSGWLTRKFPGIDLLGHDFGHLWYTALGFKGNPHLNPIHIASYVLIGGGFFLLSASWRVLYRAQQAGSLATTGPYAWVRHPQYLAFIVIMFGFLVQWPTLVTLLMFPILVVAYVRLARREEREMAAQLGDVWTAYAHETPAWFPRLRRKPSPTIEVTRDPVCGMVVDRLRAAGTRSVEGRTYYFCSKRCLEKFDRHEVVPPRANDQLANLKSS